MSHNTVNNEQYFNTDHVKANLKSSSVRGGAVTMIAQVSKFILQMGSTVVLASKFPEQAIL